MRSTCPGPGRKWHRLSGKGISGEEASTMVSSSYFSRHTQSKLFRLYRQRRLLSVGASNSSKQLHEANLEAEDIPTSGISRPLSHILKELNKKVPETLVKLQSGPSGSSGKHIPWHIVNRIMNLHAPEWSGEVRNITYSADGKTVSVVYRVTLYGTDAEIFRESTGSAAVSEEDPLQKAEAMAFRRACARFGLGLHLCHDDMN